MIISFLIKILNVDESIANKDACYIEHLLSENTKEKMLEFLKKFTYLIDKGNFNENKH